MAHNQGGLNSIASISGVQPPDTSAVLKVPQIGDYNYTKTQQTNNNKHTFGLLTRDRTPMNPQQLRATLDSMPNTLGAKVLPVGANRQLGIG